MSRIAIDVRKLADFGIGTYVRGLLTGLAELPGDERYLLLGPDRLRAEAPPLPERFSWVGVEAPGYSLRELWALSRAARRVGAELYHAPHYVLPLALPCPAVVTVHDLIHLRFRDGRGALASLYAAAMVRRALRAEATLTVSETTRRELVEWFGARAARVEAIPNGVDERFRRPGDPAADAAVLARLGLEPGYLLFVGNPKPHKNLERLLAAHRRLRAARAGVPPLVVAGGELPDPAPPDGVVGLGRLADADVPALVRGALALVVPSLWEGFGLPALEAMAAGTPVAAADAGALPEVVGDAALRFDPRDADAIAGAVASLLDDASLRATLAAKGRERAAGYTWRRTAEATLAVYRRVLASHGSGS